MKKKSIILILITAMVLCLAGTPVLADDDSTVTDLEFTIEVPKCNTYVEGTDRTDLGDRQHPTPVVTLPDDSVFVLSYSDTETYAEWWYLKEYSGGYSLQRFGRAADNYMRGGNSYYARVYLKYYGPKSVSEDLNVTVHGGKEFEGYDAKTEVYDFSQFENYGYWSVILTVKVDIEHEFGEWIPDPDSYTHATTEAPGIHIEKRTCSLCGGTEEKTVIDEEQLVPEPEPEPEPEPAPAPVPAAPDTGDGDRFIMLALELYAAVLACVTVLEIYRTRKTMNGRK